MSQTMRKRKIRMARLVPRDEAERDFDEAFWHRVGAEGRFAAIWQMVKEVQAIRGKDGHQSRLQRSVEHIERLPRLVRVVGAYAVAWMVICNRQTEIVHKTN